MFSQLTNFGYKRTSKEAFGFYLAYLLLMMIIGGIFALVLVPSDVTTEAEAFDAGAQIGARFVPIAVMTIGILVLNAKKTLFEFKNIILLLLAGFLAIIGGGLLGLIPIAYITTTEAAESSDKNSQPVKKNPVKKLQR